MKRLLVVCDEVADLVESSGMQDDELRAACKRHIDSLVR